MSLHVCTFKDECRNENPPSSACIGKLLECLEPELYGPVTTEQCLRRHGHTNICVKAVSHDDLSIYVRNVQADFLQKTLAQKWNRTAIKECIKRLPTDAVEAMRLLRDLPNKNRGTAEKPDYSTDQELFIACKNSEDASLIVETFDQALATKEPKYAVTAFASLISKNEAARKSLIEKAIGAIMATNFESRGENVKCIELSNRLCIHFRGFVPQKYQEGWKAFEIILDEQHRVSDLFNHEALFFSAYSTSKQSVVDVEDLYTSLEDFARSEAPQEYWKTIPDSLKKEYALSFTCILHRLITHPAANQKSETYSAILTEFTQSCKNGYYQGKYG